jgi:carbamoyl-phosphate synthase large subunit
MTRGSSSPLTVAVTGINAEHGNPGPGLAVCRCLREALGQDIRIVGLGYDAYDPGLYLPRYFDAGYLVSYPSSGEQALFERLSAIHALEHFDAIIPCLDSEIPLMIRLESRLNDLGIHSFLPTLEQLRLRNKDRLAELAQRAGVRYPELVAVNHAGFFATCAQQGWSYPLVVKGVFYDAQVVATIEDGAATFRRIAAQWGLPVLVQRFVKGEEINLTALGDGRGAMLGAVMMKKRAITAKGKAWAGVATFDQRLQDVAAALVAELRWRGPLEVEVMRDADGDYHLIEINPRFPAWVYLTQGVGRNLPAALLDLILGRAPPEFAEPRTGTMFIRYAEETIVPLSSYESVVIGGHCQHPIIQGA